MELSDGVRVVEVCDGIVVESTHGSGVLSL